LIDLACGEPMMAGEEFERLNALEALSTASATRRKAKE
jgi:hypothetical protein